jgi:hypothetical protein
MRLTTLSILLPIALTTAFPIAPAVVQIIKPHSPRAAEAVAEAIVDPPPHHSGAVNVPLPPREAIKRSALAEIVCRYLSGHRYCQHPPSARDDDARGTTIYQESDLKGKNDQHLRWIRWQCAQLERGEGRQVHFLQVSHH